MHGQCLAVVVQCTSSVSLVASADLMPLVPETRARVMITQCHSTRACYHLAVSFHTVHTIGPNSTAACGSGTAASNVVNVCRIGTATQ